MGNCSYVGNVKINYEFYETSDVYSDGDDAENEMLRISQDRSWGKIIKESDKWHILYHFSEIRNNVIEWFPYKKDGNLLEIGSGCGALTGMLCKKVSRVVGVDLSERRTLINAYRNSECNNLELIVGNFSKIRLEEKFDYITLIGVLEYAQYYVKDNNPYEALLNMAKELLKPNGVIIIAIENKMGMKYLNGAKEDHIGKSYVGIEDYRYEKIRTFSKPELEKLFMKCNMEKYTFYYPYPDYKLPESVYSDSYAPKVGEIRLWGTNYDRMRLCLYNDAIMADQICRDNMNDYFANSFIVLLGEMDKLPAFVHYTNTRNAEFQTKTTIDDSLKMVKKEYLKDVERKYHIFNNMKTFISDLDKEFVNVTYLNPDINENSLEYSYIDGISLEQLLFEYRHDGALLIEEFRRLWNMYYKCSDDYETDFYVTEEYNSIFGNNYISSNAKSYKYTNIDMLLHNLIMADGRVYCIDYEWIVNFPVPKEFVLYRAAMDFYRKYHMYFGKNISKERFLVAIGIHEEDIDVFQKMAKCFEKYVYGDENYLVNYRKERGTLEIK